MKKRILFASVCLAMLLVLASCDFFKHKHAPSDAVRENEVAATCQSSGSYDEVVYCSSCGEEMSRTQQTVDRISEHKPAEPVRENEVAATCNSFGSYDKVIYCAFSDCGAELSREVKVIEKNDHSPDDPVIENKIDATCTEGGSYNEVVYCAVCEEELSHSSKTIEKYGHDYVDGKCLGCGENKENLDLEFILNSDSMGYSISGIGKSTVSHIAIPSVYEDLPVTTILSGAFSEGTYIKSITVPSSITLIEGGAFSGCSSLESIVLPFVGERIKTSADKYQYPLGYIFGTTEYEGSVATAQRYRGSSASTTQYTETTFYIPKALKNVTVTGGDILYGAFYGCNHLVTVKIPNVTSIGRSAFNRCTALRDFVIPESVTDIGVYAFLYCSSLKEIVIPDAVSVICDNAFEYCTNLKSISLGKGIKDIGSYAFSNCTNIQYIYFNGSNMNNSYKNNYIFQCIGQSGPGINLVIGSDATVIPAYLFAPSNSVAVAPKIVSVEFEEKSICQSIGVCSFWSCAFLENITIPESVTQIGEWAFRYCTGLQSITIPGNVLSIGDAAFYHCVSLESVTMEKGIKSIGSSAFYECYRLATITIPEGIVTINASAFTSCYKLLEVINKSSLAITAGSEDFGGVAYYAMEVHSGDSKIVNRNGYLFYKYQDRNYLIDYVGEDTELLLPESFDGECYEIYDYAFYLRSDIKNVVISKGVTGIGRMAFLGCTGLTNITIPESVTYIGAYAFQNCSNLKYVTFAIVNGWWINTVSDASNGTYIFSDYNGNTSQAAECLKSTYCKYYWYRD